MRGTQDIPYGIAVLDLAVKIVLHVARVLDLLLEGRQNPQGMVLGPLSEKLQESEILIEALRRGLGAEKLRQLVDDQEKALGKSLLNPLPYTPPIRLTRLFHFERLIEDRLERPGRLEVEQRKRRDRSLAPGKGSALELLGQVGKEMRFAGAVLAYQENAATCVFRQQDLQRLEVSVGFFGDIVAGADPAGIGAAQVLEADHRRLRDHLYVVADFHASALG